MDSHMEHSEAGRSNLPVVFVGPSIPLHEARKIVDADFRPPCRRGDLANLPGGSLIGLIDGVFYQNDAVSPRELVYALQRGVRILGSSSMGALRAVEVPGIQGVGHVYEMYKSGVIDSDDEVALIFDSEKLVPLTVPLVNVRYAVERLHQSGTINSSVSARILEAAQKLHFTERTYRRILQAADLGNKADAEDLLNLLKSFDLKRDDARLLLERLAQIVQSSPASAVIPNQNGGIQTRPDYGPEDNFANVKVSDEADAIAPVLIWEMGVAVPFLELVLFLKLTGNFERYARNALLRLQSQQGGRLPQPLSGPGMEELKEDFHRLCRAWGWKTEREVQVTMTDLGVGFKDALRQLKDEAIVCRTVAAFARNPDTSFLKTLRYELFFDDLALKREAMRYGSFKTLGAEGCVMSEEAEKAARSVMCRLHGVPGWERLSDRLSDLGITEADVRQFFATLTNVRERSSAILSFGEPADELKTLADESFGLQPSLKSSGEHRFCLSIEQAYQHVTRFRELIGVTRVGMITGLTELEGVHVCQAARPDGAWSSSYGSGKSETKEGAIVGSIMEETEKWAQEQFQGDPVWSSYALLREQKNALDPKFLDLPYDSIYDENLEFAWQECFDLIQGRPIWVPLAAIACSFNAGKNNIYHSKRGARVTFSTNGLASGFTLAEALVHATCEYIERHAARMSELRVENPGLSDQREWPRQINPFTLPEAIRKLIERLGLAGCKIGIWDITSEVSVPTLSVRITKNREVARGWAAHPNPSVACHMAILEACQTIVAAVAAGREDLTIQARSLGRHERSSPLRTAAHLFWENGDEGCISLSQIQGLVADDAYSEFTWIRTRLMEAGVRHLIAIDLTRKEMKPACAVRVILPGLETNNPYFCGLRARLALLSDMIPRDSDFNSAVT